MGQKMCSLEKSTTMFNVMTKSCAKEIVIFFQIRLLNGLRISVQEGIVTYPTIQGALGLITYA